MKRILSFILVTAMLCSLNGTAYAVCVDYDGDGVCDGEGSPGTVPEPPAPTPVPGGGETNTPQMNLSEDQKLDFLMILLAPVPLIFGLCRGSSWYWKRLFGAWPGINWLTSYSDYLTEGFTKEFFATRDLVRVGGSPFLILYPPSLGIKAVVSAPFLLLKKDPEEVRRLKAQYTAVIDNYRLLERNTARQLEHLEIQRNAAYESRNALVEEFIETHADLRKLRDEKGADAARAAAVKRLDVYLEASRKQKQIQQSLHETADELEAIRSKACEKFKDDISAVDYIFEKNQNEIEAILESDRLTPTFRKRLRDERFVYSRVERYYTVFGIVGEVKDAAVSLKSSVDNGGTYAQWFKEHEHQEELGRIALHILGNWGGDTAEQLMDSAYAATAGVVLSGQIEKIRAEASRISMARFAQDLWANRWQERRSAVEAGDRNIDGVNKQRKKYAEQVAIYEKKLNKLQQ